MVVIVTIRAYSNRISAVHRANASTTATAIEVTAHGLYISQPGIPARSAARPPSQNQPGG